MSTPNAGWETPVQASSSSHRQGYYTRSGASGKKTRSSKGEEASSSSRARLMEHLNAAGATSTSSPAVSLDSRLVPVFYLNGTRLLPEWTLYQAVRRLSPTVGSLLSSALRVNLSFGQNKDDLMNQILWSIVHTLQYKLVPADQVDKLIANDSQLDLEKSPSLSLRHSLIQTDIASEPIKRHNLGRHSRHPTPPLDCHVDISFCSKHSTMDSSCSTISSASSCCLQVR
ncbi:hypothetical protein Ciccas_003825 [Cichlidogyrus casuarinus]|uniref:Uncharacterized protein n=1 Tax=Cichlidogyrus casuarinus TaxID=1844966 RepID=A0ABD2QD82_9PLAT